MLLAYIYLAFRVLLLDHPQDYSVWTILVLWAARIVSLSLIFRTYVGPSLLRLVTNRLRVRSISLRSVRGIYFRARSGTWRIDRVGISYHRPSSTSASRFSIVVEGLKLELAKREPQVLKPSLARKRPLPFALSPLAKRVWSISRSSLGVVYAFLDPYTRPIIRTSFVGALRLIIRALPTLTHVVDFELNSAEVTLSALPGVRLAMTQAQVQTKVSLSLLDSVVNPGSSLQPQHHHRHRRFASVADWNARLASSVRRTWDRAWGATRVTTSFSLRIKDISGTASAFSLKDLPTATSTGVVTFVDIPSTEFTVSVRIDPHRTIEAHSVETSLTLDSIDLNIDVVQLLLNTVKKKCSASQTPSEHEEAPAGLTPIPTPAPTLSPSPLNTRRLTWSSPISPGSPLLGALSSASSRFRWGHRHAPVRKLSNGATTRTHITMVKAIHFAVTKLTLRHCAPRTDTDVAQTFAATAHQIELSAGLSHPEANSMHRKWLGSRSVPNDDLSADVYRFSFSTSLFTLDRSGSGAILDHLQVVSAGPFLLDTVVSQWPSPWLHGPTFLSGDPNSQLLAVNLDVGTVRITERLEILHRLLTHKTNQAQQIDPRPLLPAVLSPVPRIALGVNIGPILIRLISSGIRNDEAPFAIEARSEGFLVSFDSHYLSLADKHLGHTSHDHMGLQMDFYLTCALQRTFVSVCFGPDLNGGHRVGVPPGLLDYPGESLLSLDAVQLSGHGNAVGDVSDEMSSAVTLDLSSLFTYLQCSTEAISIELWQPEVIKALTRITMYLRDASGTATAPRPPRNVLDRLPFGLSASLSIGRLVGFVTGPDLAPGEELELSRGVASHMGVSVSYSAVHGRHSGRIRNLLLPRSQKRLSLSLPTENIVKAVATNAVQAATSGVRVLLGVAFWDIALRDAIATRYTADDPYCYAEKDENLASRGFLRIKNIDIDVILSGRRPNGLQQPGAKDDLVVNVLVSKVRSSLRLAQIYNVLLALKTLKSLAPPSPKPDVPSLPSSTLTFNLQCDVKEIQMRFDFPLQSKMYARLSYFRCQTSSGNGVNVKWSSMILAVAVTAMQDGAQKEDWEEFARLTDWQVRIPRSDGPATTTIEGDGGRLHIPFDFVLADLILDINLTIKSARHLARVVATGQYEDPSIPEAEAAKIVPNTLIKIRCLTIEAADDDLESRLGLIWRAGSQATRIRLERDEAFEAKASTIRTSKSSQLSAKPGDVDPDFQFSSKHTVSIDNARERLYQVHSVAWRSAVVKATHAQMEREESYRRHAINNYPRLDTYDDLVHVQPVKSVPPLCRMTLDALSLNLTAPRSLIDAVPDFLFRVGNGLPKDTQFSLLVPLHVNFTVASLRMSLREYPLPLLSIPPSSSAGSPALEFDSDFVIAEEMGSTASVEWFASEVVQANDGIHGAAPLCIPVPKTIMPVKTYAEPTIRVLTDNTTDFAWGVSYSPATQDLMRVIDTLSHAPRDCSPPVGFWDKLRLVFHWRLKVLFKGEVHLHMKGSRNPHVLAGTGAGFALCWRGNPCLSIGLPNKEDELIQMTSDSMLILIPNVLDTWGSSATMEGLTHLQSVSSASFDYGRNGEAKVCAKLSSGVRFGVGFVLERSCGEECLKCSGKAFDRGCRFFDFRPHYAVKLETKMAVPEPKSPEDSYNGFRSDFIHMSLSLTSALSKSHSPLNPPSSSLHLSPEVFEHFWAWYALFDSSLSLPIRQGSLYSRKRPVSPKFGQHLATLKYRISIIRLFIAHLYVDNSRDAWADGVTPFVGVKALIDRFQADLHQRDQESTRMIHGGPKAVHHKSFYAIEVIMKGLDLRSMLAIFPEPLKQQVRMEASPLISNYRSQIKSDAAPPDSAWIDMDDFRKAERTQSALPAVHLLPAAYCPQFTYFKRATDQNPNAIGSQIVRSKFGAEDTHVCFLGKEASVTQVQIGLTSSRINQLEQRLQRDTANSRRNGEHGRSADSPSNSRASDDDDEAIDLRKKITLLNDYAFHLRQVDAASATASSHGIHNYYMPSDAVSQDEWAEFDNVYQLHSPQIFMNQTTRDMMMQYYYCSRARRGIEYHMATRAVKFIRDQAQAALVDLLQETADHRGPVSSAQAAAVAVRNFFTGDGGPSTTVESSPFGLDVPGPIDPLDGWSQGVSLSKSHFCLLLKPQIVLRSEASADSDTDSVCILAAVQGKMKSFAILDDANADDPVSGKVMSRNFASVIGLQTFSPSAANKTGTEYVPLEVLIDLRCENSAFDRLVPQTDASFQYDKFNRLRLRNNTTSLTYTNQQANHPHDHLQNQTDLIRVHVPRFTVSANDRHFEAISSIVTKLLLFSDAALKDRSDKLEKMLFNYDFTNLASVADVVANMQARLRHALETRNEAVQKLAGFGDEGKVEIYKIDAHILLLVDELNLVFDAIQLAQDKANDHPEQKSALLLHASSSEISWGMLDQQDQLLAKLAVREIHFYWLSRQDSSTVNNLIVGDLQAFDGAADAEWTEILSKHDEPSNHPLVKQKRFLMADWTVLPPVGGITIYERFEITFHPMRLQIDTRIGRKIMEYVWPARRHRRDTEDDLQAFDDIPESPSAYDDTSNVVIVPESSISPRRSSWDVSPRKSQDVHRLAPPPLRKLGSSRSFTDLRNSRSETLQVPKLHKTRSTDALLTLSPPSPSAASQVRKSSDDFRRQSSQRKRQEVDDATEMKTRSSQKTFVWVKVNSLHLLLSIAKEDSFLCRDARIRTRALEYRNQTSSFEELVDQFIPSGRNWRGWVRMAFQQPLVPVLPVARELISKTKWISPRGHHSHTHDERTGSPSLLSFHGRHPGTLSTTPSSSASVTPSSSLASTSSTDTKRQRGLSLFTLHHKPQPIVAEDLTTEPEPLPDASTEDVPPRRAGGRSRMLSMFKRRHGASVRSSMDSDISNSSATSAKSRTSTSHSRGNSDNAYA